MTDDERLDALLDDLGDGDVGAGGCGETVGGNVIAVIVPPNSVNRPGICAMSSPVPGTPSAPAATFGSSGIGSVSNSFVASQWSPGMPEHGSAPRTVRSKVVR